MLVQLPAIHWTSKVTQSVLCGRQHLLIYQRVLVAKILGPFTDCTSNQVRQFLITWNELRSSSGQSDPARPSLSTS